MKTKVFYWLRHPWRLQLHFLASCCSKTLWNSCLYCLLEISTERANQYHRQYTPRGRSDHNPCTTSAFLSVSVDGNTTLLVVQQLREVPPIFSFSLAPHPISQEISLALLLNSVLYQISSYYLSLESWSKAMVISHPLIGLPASITLLFTICSNKDWCLSSMSQIMSLLCIQLAVSNQMLTMAYTVLKELGPYRPLTSSSISLSILLHKLMLSTSGPLHKALPRIVFP